MSNVADPKLRSLQKAKEQNIESIHISVSGLVVKSIVAIDGPRVRFAADACCSRVSPSVIFFVYFLRRYRTPMLNRSNVVQERTRSPLQAQPWAELEAFPPVLREPHPAPGHTCRA